MAVDTEKDSVQAGSPIETPGSPVDETTEPVVTLKTWIVSSVCM